MAFVTLAWVLQLSGLALVTVAGGLGFSDIALAAEHKQRSMQRHTSLVEVAEKKPPEKGNSTRGSSAEKRRYRQAALSKKEGHACCLYTYCAAATVRVWKTGLE